LSPYGDFREGCSGKTEPDEAEGIYPSAEEVPMIRKLKSGEYRLYSRKPDAKTNKRKNLGTFKTREAAEKHEREVQYFKHH
jgi:hypothetical protein